MLSKEIAIAELGPAPHAAPTRPRPWRQRLRLIPAALALAAAAGQPGTDLTGWTQPYSNNPLCRMQVDRVWQRASGQPIHVSLTNLSNNTFLFDLDVILDNGRTGETRQIRGATLKGGTLKVDFQTSTGYSTTGRTVKLRIDSCLLS